MFLFHGLVLLTNLEVIRKRGEREREREEGWVRGTGEGRVKVIEKGTERKGSKEVHLGGWWGLGDGMWGVGCGLPFPGRRWRERRKKRRAAAGSAERKSLSAGRAQPRRSSCGRRAQS